MVEVGDDRDEGYPIHDTRCPHGIDFEETFEGCEECCNPDSEEYRQWEDQLLAEQFFPIGQRFCEHNNPIKEYCKKCEMRDILEDMDRCL